MNIFQNIYLLKIYFVIFEDIFEVVIEDLMTVHNIRTIYFLIEHNCIIYSKKFIDSNFLYVFVYITSAIVFQMLEYRTPISGSGTADLTHKHNIYIRSKFNYVRCIFISEIIVADM